MLRGALLYLTSAQKRGLHRACANAVTCVNVLAAEQESDGGATTWCVSRRFLLQQMVTLIWVLCILIEKVKTQPSSPLNQYICDAMVLIKKL